MTTEAQIAAIRHLCEQLEISGDCKQAWPDDWGRFGNFTLRLSPALRDRGTTARLKSAVLKLLPKDAHVREYFAPDPVLVKNWHTNKKVRDWSAGGDWVFDIDHRTYSPDTNTFA